MKGHSMFRHMHIATYTFTLRALEELHLPEYKGSTLRGGFGHALRRVSCALRRQECAQCLLRERCVYLYLFETPPPKDTELMRLYPSVPHPFIIEPPLSRTLTVAEGEDLDFNLVLVGRAMEYLPYFVYAFVELGQTGLGKAKGRFTLERVLLRQQDGPEEIYSRREQVLKQTKPVPAWERVMAGTLALQGRNALTLEFLTPVRIKGDGHLVEEPEFHHLVRSLLRRISSLSYFHCGSRLELDFRGIIERATQIQCTERGLRWHDWERYSSRQKQRMTLGGFVGLATYAGALDEFLPLLALGEILHVGKAASFGLGRYRMEIAKVPLQSSPEQGAETAV